MNQNNGVEPGLNTPNFSPIEPNTKEFGTMAAGFALRGYELSRIETPSRPLYYVSRLGQSRIFTAWHDVRSFMAQIGGAI